MFIHKSMIQFHEEYVYFMYIRALYNSIIYTHIHVTLNFDQYF